MQLSRPPRLRGLSFLRHALAATVKKKSSYTRLFGAFLGWRPPVLARTQPAVRRNDDPKRIRFVHALHPSWLEIAAAI